MTRNSPRELSTQKPLKESNGNRTCFCERAVRTLSKSETNSFLSTKPLVRYLRPDILQSFIEQKKGGASYLISDLTVG